MAWSASISKGAGPCPTSGLRAYRNEKRDYHYISYILYTLLWQLIALEAAQRRRKGGPSKDGFLPEDIIECFTSRHLNYALISALIWYYVVLHGMGRCW